MGIPIRAAGVDNLSDKAAMMRESLQKSQSITDNMVSMLGSFDHRLSALETAMRPTQVKLIMLWSVFQLYSFPTLDILFEFVVKQIEFEL